MPSFNSQNQLFAFIFSLFCLSVHKKMNKRGRERVWGCATVKKSKGFSPGSFCRFFREIAVAIGGRVGENKIWPGRAGDGWPTTTSSPPALLLPQAFASRNLGNGK